MISTRVKFHGYSTFFPLPAIPVNLGVLGVGDTSFRGVCLPLAVGVLTGVFAFEDGFDLFSDTFNKEAQLPTAGLGFTVGLGVSVGITLVSSVGLLICSTGLFCSSTGLRGSSFSSTTPSFFDS